MPDGGELWRERQAPLPTEDGARKPAVGVFRPEAVEVSLSVPFFAVFISIGFVRQLRCTSRRIQPRQHLVAHFYTAKSTRA